MIIYIIDERKALDADSMKNNNNLETLIKLREKYKIPFLLLLTHSDKYCDEVKKSDNNWKEICKKQINANKENLLEYINDLIKKNSWDYTMDKNSILHTVLLEQNNKMDVKEIVKNLDVETQKEYNEGDEATKSMILKIYSRLKGTMESEVDSFLNKEIKILRPKDLIEEIKKILPSQYHNALKEIK